MPIKKIYQKYIKHFKKTVTLSEFHLESDENNLIALRHDVDYDIDIAMEMSCLEYRNGIRATYFVLPGSNYWQDPNLIEKFLQIQDFGHEIGLHLNVITEWMQGEINDPNQRLFQLLSSLRTGGIKITGVSAHGDRLCYTHQFINYWLLGELRPDRPVQAESGLSAEGIPSIGDRPSIAYPKNHTLIRDDGCRLSLWTVSMKQHKLDYHAIHIPHDKYFTDSGGEWDRSPNPLDFDITHGRNQVLIHPEYWRGHQKIFFFLSTARSGSKWLSTVLDEASSLKSRHEFLINHRIEKGNVVEDKRTADGFTELQANPQEVLELLLEMRPWIEELNCDYAEVNVYLENFLTEIKKAFPEAVTIHLHRQPSDVIRSIINRNWYDTPEDNRHPKFKIKEWSSLSQFQRACWYARMVNENLMNYCSKRLAFKEMIKSPETLTAYLNDLGIAFYPRLAEPYFKKKINISKCYDFPDFTFWTQEQKQYYHDICGDINRLLGYLTSQENYDIPNLSSKSKPILKDQIDSILNFFPHLFKRFHRDNFSNLKTDLKTPITLPLEIFLGTPSNGVNIETDNGELTIIPKAKQNVHFLFGGGSWYKIEKNKGWDAQLGHYYRGTIEANLPEQGHGTARLVCIMYDKSGRILSHRTLVRLRPKKKTLSFSFRPGSQVKRFNLALYMPKTDLPQKVVVQSLFMEKLPLGYE
jgi:hypothetical protein